MAAGGTCAIGVSFTPSAVGARSGSIAINHNATPATSSVLLAGTGAAVVVGAPVATPSSAVVTFANAAVGTWAPSQTVTVTNTGSGPLNIAALSISNAEFVASVNSCSAGATIAPGASCVITVQFKPSAAGMRLATITLAHNASPAVTTIALSGLGVLPANAAPIVDLNSAALSLPSTPVGSSSPGVGITLTNTGNAPLVLSDFLVLGDPVSSPSEFSVAATNCTIGMTLEASAHCTLIINFSPTSVGSKKGTLTFSHNASSGLTSISLTSVATAAATTAPPTRAMVEYRYAPLNYYFITSRDAEKAALDAIPDFQRTGESFLVYSAQQGSMRAITRFYFDEARAGMHSSHFYTLLDSDLVLLADQNPTRSTAPNMAQNEGVDSFAIAPLVSGVGGRCATGLLPVYRVFRGNARFPNDPNHRFTTSRPAYDSAVAAGWDGEGVNFCVPAQ